MTYREWIAAVRDTLIVFVLVAGIAIGAYVAARVLSDHGGAALPSYCYAGDARAAAPECQGGR